MKNCRLYFALFWTALGGFVAGYSYHLGLGRIQTPGPGLFPFCLGLLFCLLALYSLAQLLVGVGKQGEAAEGRKAAASPYGTVAMVVASLFIYGIVLEPLGFQITTFLLLALLFRSAGVKRWPFVLLYSLVTVLVTYFLFTYLGVRFPSGILKVVGMY